MSQLPAHLFVSFVYFFSVSNCSSNGISFAFSFSIGRLVLCVAFRFARRTKLNGFPLCLCMCVLNAKSYITVTINAGAIFPIYNNRDRKTKTRTKNEKNNSSGKLTSRRSSFIVLNGLLLFSLFFLIRIDSAVSITVLYAITFNSFDRLLFLPLYLSLTLSSSLHCLFLGVLRIFSECWLVDLA